MAPSQPTDEPSLVLRIESLAAGGDGVGRDESGRVVFVPETAPGDRVRVRVLEARKRFARAACVEVLEPGPGRGDARCPLFGHCGGCAWQHVDYPTQVDAKAAIVADALRRIGRFEERGPVPITPSPEPYGYRTRTRLVQAEGGLGYRMKSSHQVAVARSCPVLDPRLERALTSARPAAEGVDGQEWEAAVGADGRVRLDPAEAPGSQIDLEVGGERLRISHGVFAQANGLLLETLVARVLALCGEAGPEAQRVSAVELYAGAGLFTLGLARLFDQVWAVESHPGAIVDLQFNLRRASRENVRVQPGTVESSVSRLGVQAPDLLLLDPPRAGLSAPALEAALGLTPKRVVYVSCDPATLARDLARLCDEGYRLAGIEAFDLFPQTPHVEVLAVLDRLSGGGPARGSG